MSERLPDSIPNNYSLQEQPGGLVVAESRANHSYKQHPHPIGGESDLGPTEHEKTRGIVYTETELAGKPFIVAERPKPAVKPPTGEQSPESSEPASAERAENAKGSTKVQYEPDENGHVRLGSELTNPGHVLDWSKGGWTGGENRTIILETENGDKYYVKGDTIYDLAESGRIGMPATWALDEKDDEAKLPNVTIGEPWELAPDFATGPIKKIVIGEDIAPQGYLGEHGPIDAEYEKRGKNPFQDAEESLRLLGADDETSEVDHEAPTAVMDAEPADDDQTPADRWTRLKRGVRRHMYEAPIKETPMGPAFQPAVSFDEWYEARQQDGESAIERFDRLYTFPAKEKINRKAGDAYLKAGDLVVGATVLVYDTADLLGGKAKAAGKSTAEHARRATLKADYIGQLLLNRMATVPEQIREYLNKRSDKEEGEEEANG